MDEQQDQKNTKICPHCKTEIPADAKVCPNCRKKVKHTGRNIFLIILGVLLLIGLVSCFAGGSGSSTDTSSETKKTEYTVGETATVDGVDVTLDSVYTTSSITSTSGFDYPAEDGNVYLVEHWSIKNNSDATWSFTTGSFAAYVDNQSVNSDILTYSADEPLEFSELSSGRETSGNVVYKIPSTWQNFENEVDVNLFSTNKVKFIIHPDQAPLQ